ncbi:MAG: hypothetical protein L0Z71_10510 [Anaerolineae bacterium]|nr:hypothetical protein [Anaerolineae bacterium]
MNSENMRRFSLSLWERAGVRDQIRRLPWFETILIVVVMSMSLYAALSDAQNLSLRWFTRDDAYYYFKVAQNISEGYGSTFDRINPTNGYHPLWMSICIPIFALARFDLVLPLRILLLVMSGLSVATGILLYRLIGKVFAPAIGAIAALFWVFSFDVLGIVYQHGLETGIAAFFVVLLVYKLFEFEKSWRKNAVSRRQILILGIIAALAMFSRLDLVFLAGIVGLWILFRGHLLRYFLPLDIASIMISTLLAFVLRAGLPDYYQLANVALVMAFCGLIVKIPCTFLFGLYQHSGLSNSRELLKRLFLSTITSSAIVGALIPTSIRLGMLEGSFPRITILTDFIFTFILFGISRLIFIGLQTNRTIQYGSDDKPLAYFLKHWKQWFSEGLVYYSVVLGPLGIYMLWNKLAFGTFSPVSGQIKQWWADLPGRAYGGSSRDILSFLGINYWSDGNAWNPASRIIGFWAENLYKMRIIDTWRYLILLTLLALIFYFVLRSNRQKGKRAVTQLAIIPLLSGAWLQVLYYNSSGYASFKEWYWVSQLILIVLSLSLMLGMLYKLLHRFQYAQIAFWILAVYMGISMGAAFWKNIHTSMPYNYWSADAPFIDVGPLLEEHTEPGSLIGITGGGNIGYFIHDRTILNMDGLINSYAYFQALQVGQAGTYLENIGLDYVLANPVILDQQPYKGQYNEYMDHLNIYYGGKQLMRYGAP